MLLPKIHVNEIRKWAPCFDPLMFNDPDFKGDAIDVLNYEACDVEHRFWVAMRPEYFPENPEVLTGFVDNCIEHICGGECGDHNQLRCEVMAGGDLTKVKQKMLDLKLKECVHESDPRIRVLNTVKVLAKMSPDCLEWARLHLLQKLRHKPALRLIARVDDYQIQIKKRYFVAYLWERFSFWFKGLFKKE